MRKWSKIIYSGNGWDMTVRELMFSIVIILIMLMGGFFISEKIASHNDEQNQEYYQAMEMDIFDAGRDGATEYVHKKLASGIGLKLAEEGFVKFETGRNPAHRGIIIRASVNVVKP